MIRVVSLIASASEIVCALGLEENLVGRSHECDYPESILRLPVCTAPKFDVHGSSADIDRRVRETLRTAKDAGSASVYAVHADVLNELRPDVIITQSQCEVCAVSRRDVEQALAESLDFLPRVVALESNSLANVWTDIERVAEALNVSGRGKELVTRLQDRLGALARRAQSASSRPAVACLEWLDPLMAAGNWVPELVALAGGTNLFGTAGKHSPSLSWDEVCARDPEVIVAMPCGLDLSRTRKEMSALVARPGWPGLSAVRDGRVFVTDGNQFFNRPGPRLVESAEILAELFHPDLIHFGYEGTGWQRYLTSSGSRE
jgi:iron complex transport system substrate-binding protein